MKEQKQPGGSGDGQEVSNVFELIGVLCNLSVRATDALALYLSSGDMAAADQVREIGYESERQRSNSLDILRWQFTDSPLREATHSAINSIVEIIHYTRTTVREMDMLRVTRDEHMERLGTLIVTGVRSISDGYARLAIGETDVEDNVETARRSEWDAGDEYRKALSELFNPEYFIKVLDSKELPSDGRFLGYYLQGKPDRHGAAATALAYIVDIFRRREVLRHLSNAADRVLHAGNVLHELATQAAVNTKPVGGPTT